MSLTEATVENGRRVHDLKEFGVYFCDLLAGRRSVEVRIRDRDYRRKDWLRITIVPGTQEPGESGAHTIMIQIKNILTPTDVPGLQPDFCLMELHQSTLTDVTR